MSCVYFKIKRHAWAWFSRAPDTRSLPALGETQVPQTSYQCDARMWIDQARSAAPPSTHFLWLMTPCHVSTFLDTRPVVRARIILITMSHCLKFPKHLFFFIMWSIISVFFCQSTRDDAASSFLLTSWSSSLLLVVNLHDKPENDKQRANIHSFVFSIKDRISYAIYLVNRSKCQLF